MGAEEKRITALDMRIAVSVLICGLTATVLDHFGVNFSIGTMKLEIVQKMTSCIACLLCCQENLPASRKASINRLIITAIGGLTALAVILIDQAAANEWLMPLMVAAGVLLTLYLCKAAGVPYINARIGGVTFVLVACTLPGTARIWYGVFRLVSTMYAVLVVMAVTWMTQKISSR